MVSVARQCPFLLTVRILVQLIDSVASSGWRSIASVKFQPSYVHGLVAGENKTILLKIALDTNHDDYAKFRPEQKFRVALKSMDNEIASATIFRNDVKLNEFRKSNMSLQTYHMNCTVSGHFLGKTAIAVRLQNADDGDGEDLTFHELPRESSLMKESELLDVWVVQDSKRLVNKIFLVSLVFLIIIANILMGCELDMQMVVETIKKPVAPLIGFCTQFVAMPLLAYSIANVIFLSRGMHSFALGLFISGCAPSGGASNYWTLLLDGNLPVSVTMTFVSSLAALVMMPFWVWALGDRFLLGFHPEAEIKIPYIKIISSLATMIIPLILGIILSRYFPSIRHRARKCIRPFLIFVLIFLIGFGALANIYMIRILTWPAVLGGLLLPWCGFTIGCFASILLRQSPANVTAIAVETGIQNTGIAIMLLKFSFPDPDADISSLMPVIVACMTPVPLLLMVFIHSGVKFIRKKSSLGLSDAEAVLEKAPKAISSSATSVMKLTKCERLNDEE